MKPKPVAAIFQKRSLLDELTTELKSRREKPKDASMDVWLARIWNVPVEGVPKLREDKQIAEAAAKELARREREAKVRVVEVRADNPPAAQVPRR